MFQTFNLRDDITYSVFVGIAPPVTIPFDSHANMYCLIFDKTALPTEKNHILCSVDNEAQLSVRSDVIRSNEAITQSWQVIYYPQYGSVLLRNFDGVFLCTKTTSGVIKIGAGKGLTDENCFWELKHVTGSNPFSYKIYNIRSEVFLKRNGMQLTTIADVNQATVWDFDISGTVPPP